MSNAQMQAQPHARASATDWIAVTAGALGALMAPLDISITNSALPQIQSEIGAIGTEGTWISTAYLMSEIVMIPLAAGPTSIERGHHGLQVAVGEMKPVQVRREIGMLRAGP